MSDQAIILFAHGARDPEWVAPFVVIQRQLQAARPDTLVLTAYQEFMPPTLAAAVAQAAARGAKRVVGAPLVDEERQRHPQLELQVLPAIGDAPEVLQAISDWISSMGADR